jgi:hypothetical protein
MKMKTPFWWTSIVDNWFNTKYSEFKILIWVNRSRSWEGRFGPHNWFLWPSQARTSSFQSASVVVISVFRNLTFERWVVCVAVLCYIVDHWCLIYYFQSDEHSRKDYIKIWFVRMMLEFDVEKLITVVEQLLCNFTYKWMYLLWR